MITTNDGDDRLTPGSSYEVYVRAQNGESPSGVVGSGYRENQHGGNSQIRYSMTDPDNIRTETEPNTMRHVSW